MPQAKKATGRPSAFAGLDMGKVKMLAERGWTDEEMSNFFGVARSTWSKWKAENKDFADTLKDWKTEADARVERSLYERACGYSHPEDKIFNADGAPLIVPTTKHYPPDTVACIFWLKNRMRDKWRDRPEEAATDEKPEVVVVE